MCIHGFLPYEAGHQNLMIMVILFLVCELMLNVPVNNV